MTKPSYEELERLCECGYPRRMHGDPLTACCGKYKAASDINEEGKLLHLIQLAVCDPVEAVKGNMPSPAKAVEMIIDKVYQAGIKVADMTMEVAYAKGREEAAYEQVSKYWKRVEAVEAELNTLANTVEVERQRRFLRCPNTSSSHTTSCSIWGDDGRGHTAENFPTPLPCNCGALENFQRARAHVAESELARVRGLLQRIDRALKYYDSHQTSEAMALLRDTIMASELDAATSGAESADIGKLDTADKSGHIGCVHSAPVRGCANCMRNFPEPAGSAETGGEKAAPQNEAEITCGGCGRTYRARWDGEVIVFERGYDAEPQHSQECQLAYITEEEARLKDYGCTCPPNFRRSTQNQTVASGVEGAHEGTTADKSEPEKLNNARRKDLIHVSVIGGVLSRFRAGENIESLEKDYEVDCSWLAESSLSSPPPQADYSLVECNCEPPCSPELLPTQLPKAE